MRTAKAAQTRLRAERRDVAATERKEPLRRRLLVALGEQAATPTELKKTVDARKESVSRKLTELRDAGLVTATRDSDDRRQTIYSLTRAGRQELGRHLAFGEKRTPPKAPGSEEVAGFLREALDGAVLMRRRHNRLQDAIDRMKEIYEQAEEAGAGDIALEALAELATTQRQARQRDERERSLAIFEKMTMGAPGVEGQFVYPAIAHLAYERGKESDMGAADSPILTRHLTASVSLFEAFVEKFPHKDSKSWRSRQAWSLVGLANNLRNQSNYEDSLRNAASGLGLFEELDDDYGRTQCWFDFGFCLRLLRRFEAAWSCLDHAHRLATAGSNSFERAAAYCLLQKGEVRRCQSRTDEAKALLTEALEAGKRLDIDIVVAFATSGLAAVEFQENDLEKAQTILRPAQKMFVRCKHPEGIALNARRQATVARHLSHAGVEPDEPKVKDLIQLAEKTYRGLNSPAGVAACEIERGWMRKISPQCGDLDEIVENLCQLVNDERRTLQLDPWVPMVLKDFAKEVGGPLAKEAKSVYSQAELRLGEEGRESVQRISELSRDFDEMAESRRKKPAVEVEVVEMGGESRRKHAVAA